MRLPSEAPQARHHAEALESPAYFADLIGGPSWAAWRVLLIAIVGEELTDDERVIFKILTGRDREPLEPVEEFWGVIGCSSGKTCAMAVLAAYLAACVDHRDVLAPGERGVIPLACCNCAASGVGLCLHRGHPHRIAEFERPC